MTSAGTITCPAASGAQRWGQVGTAHDRSHSKECQWKLAIAWVYVRVQSGVKSKGKEHPCTGTEALYRPYDP